MNAAIVAEPEREPPSIKTQSVQVRRFTGYYIWLYLQPFSKIDVTCFLFFLINFVLFLIAEYVSGACTKSDMPHDTDRPYPIRIWAFFEIIRPYQILIRIGGKLLENIFFSYFLKCSKRRTVLLSIQGDFFRKILNEIWPTSMIL